MNLQFWKTITRFLHKILFIIWIKGNSRMTWMHHNKNSKKDLIQLIIIIINSIVFIILN